MKPTAFCILGRKDVLAGLFFMGIGLFGLWASRNYAVGTALNMGTGYMPRLLCWILVALGGLIAGIGAIAGRDAPLQTERLRWRPLVFAPLAILVFALSIERLGVIIATVALVAVGALAGRELRTFEVALTAVVLIAFTMGVFIWGLGLTIRIWPEW